MTRNASDLFQRLPGHFRSRDAENGQALEALMQLFQDELNILETDVRYLYDNWFVETCEPWALAYIASLIGATPMRDIGVDQQGLLRAYIANVLQYRQAKGTAAVLEQVARDVSGWPVVAVEFFQRVTTSQNVNHVRPNAVAFPSVRNSGAVRYSRSPFSTMAHSAAAGAADAWAGRYNIPHVGLFIWRHTAAPTWPVENDQPGYIGGAQAQADASEAGLLRFDPLQRDLPLVNRPSADRTIAARMSQRTVPMLLNRDQVRDALDDARITGTSSDRWFEDSPPFRIRLAGSELSAQQMFCCNLEKADDGSWRRPVNAGEVLVDPVLGRISLHPDDEDLSIETGFAHGIPFDVGGGAYDRRNSLEKWLPDLSIDGETPVWQIGVSKVSSMITDDPLQGGPVVNSLREAVRRWNVFSGANANARGIIAIMDNASYSENISDARRILLQKGAQLAIVAAAWPATELGGGVLQREPGQLSPMHRRPILDGRFHIDAADAAEDEPGSLIIDGLVISNRIFVRPARDLGALRLYNCTIGVNNAELQQGVFCSAGSTRMSLLIDSCIVGSIDLPVATGALDISRSIVGEDLTASQAAGAEPVVLRVPQMDVTLSGSTVFGRGTSRTINAQNCLLPDIFSIKHRQTGCVRFCFVHPLSAYPRRYRCISQNDANARPVFVSTRFQDTGFGQLSLCTSNDILEGADEGMEMGVGFYNRDPARRANMRDAIQEFGPFGQIPGLIFLN